MSSTTTAPLTFNTASSSGLDDTTIINDLVAARSDRLTTMQSQLTSTFTTLQKADVKGELKTAFEQSAACKQLAASA